MKRPYVRLICLLLMAALPLHAFATAQPTAPAATETVAPATAPAEKAPSENTAAPTTEASPKAPVAAPAKAPAEAMPVVAAPAKPPAVPAPVVNATSPPATAPNAVPAATPASPAIAAEVKTPTPAPPTVTRTLATVDVSAEAPDAIAAQRKALAEGEAKAFLEVLRNAAPRRAEMIAAKISPAQRAQLLKSVSVENENARAGTYAATVTYVFEEAKIHALVEEQKGMLAEMAGNGLLILPLYNDGKQVMLWEPENFWRSVLARQALEKGQGTLIVPFGDSKDSQLAPTVAVQGGAKDSLMEIARRYGTRNAAIVTARLAQKDNMQIAEIRLRRPGQPAEEDVVLTFPAKNASETPESLLQRAAGEAILKLREINQQFSLFTPPDSQKLKGRVLRAEFPQWRDWMVIRKQLDGLPGVDFVDIGAISAQYAQVTLYYRGEESPIQRALTDRGLQVLPSADFWTISLR